MPSNSPDQQFAAQQAMDIKTGKMSSSDATRGGKEMSQMSIKKLKHFLKLKEVMTIEHKKRFLNLLKKIKEEYTGNVGGETDITNADNLQVNEDEFTSGVENKEREVVAKTFDTEGDYDSYVNQRRGIEMTPKEQQSIISYDKAKPTQRDRFFVKYENTDDFGKNKTVIVKKLKEGNQFVWTAFTKVESASEEGKPEIGSNETEIIANDNIRIIKSITFRDEIEGSDILSDFLEKLEI